MKVSIITVVYNNASTILSAIDSVYHQTYKNVEHIIIDGNSSDGTLDVIKSDIYKISILKSEVDSGIYDAMNKGISLASGEILAILNSDDIFYDNNIISEVVSQFEFDPYLDILFGNIVYVKHENTNSVVRKWISRAYYTNFFEDGHVPPHPSLFLRKSVYERHGLFNLRYKLAADYEFMLRIFKSGVNKSIYVNRTIVKMRLGGATNKSFRNIIRGNKEIFEAWIDNGYNVPILLFVKRFFRRISQFI